MPNAPTKKRATKLMLVDPMDYWAEHFDDLAQREGWSLYNAEGKISVQKIDASNRLNSDTSAIGKVSNLALRGSVMHAVALYFEGRKINDLVDIPPAFYLKPKELHLWLRIGDGGEYENHGQDMSALVDSLYESLIYSREISWLNCPRNPQKFAKEIRSPYLPAAGFSTPSFDGHNYVSLFWGDGEGNLVQPLTKVEQRQVKLRLKKLDRIRKQMKQKSAF